MSDEKLRELERRWRASGTVEDEAAYLRERVRVGELSEQRLELAAYCGHAPAMSVATGTPAPWPRDLWRFGAEALIRAAIAGARFAEEVTPSDKVWTVLAIDRLEEWIAQPGPETAEAVAATVRRGRPDHGLEHAAPLLTESGPPEPGVVRSAAMNGLAWAGGEWAVPTIWGELEPWALGTSDPVRERVEARKRGQNSA